MSGGTKCDNQKIQIPKISIIENIPCGMSGAVQISAEGTKLETFFYRGVCNRFLAKTYDNNKCRSEKMSGTVRTCPGNKKNSMIFVVRCVWKKYSGQQMRKQKHTDNKIY